MKRVLGSVFVALAVALAAMPVSAQTYNWSGPYVGLNVGGVLGDADAHTSTVFSPTGYFAGTSVPEIRAEGAQRLSPNGFTGGGQAGYNWQMGNFVYGAEVGFGAFDTSGSLSGRALYPCCAPTGFTIKQSVSTGWLLTASPHIGFASDNWLFTGSAGLAMTDVTYHGLFTDTFANAHESGGTSQVKLGWTVGAAANYAFTPHWSLRAEYLYADFGSVSTTSTNLRASVPPGAFPTNVYSQGSDLRSHIFRVGVDYHF